MKHTSRILIALASALPFSAMAGAHMGKPEAKSDMPAPAATAAALSEGEVRKVDKEAGKITIKHGPLVNLDMPPMSMVFRVKDPAMLEAVKAGDKINFTAEKVNGALTVTKLQPAK